MHVLFVHKNFPAQFGHIGKYLVEREGFMEEAVVEAFLALLTDRFEDHEMAGNIRAFLAGRQFRVLRRSLRSVVDRALAAPWS